MATIQVRDLPDEVAAVFRRRAEASGQSLQAYMREQLIALARRRDKAEVMAVVEQTLARDPGPGMSTDTVVSIVREMRGE
ncbi:MAG TPA: antitoxin [Pseudonocardiaceae bacterium]|nr:antitoxin [Pseudonocardiaceae bacterium]